MPWSSRLVPLLATTGTLGIGAAGIILWNHHHAAPPGVDVSCAGNVNRVVLEGVTQLPATEVRQVQEAFTGQPLTMEHGLRLLRRVADLYNSHDLPMPTLKVVESGCVGELRLAVAEQRVGTPGQMLPPTEAQTLAAGLPYAPLPAEALDDLPANAAIAGYNAVASPPQPILSEDLLATLAQLFQPSPVGWAQTTSRHHRQPTYRTLPLIGETGNMVALLPPPDYASAPALREVETPVVDAEGRASPDMAESPNPDVATFIPGDDDMLLLDLTVNNVQKNRLITAYLGEDGAIWVPLTPFFRALYFPIGVNPAAGVARGWFLDESNSFALDIASKKLAIGGQTVPWPEDSIRRQDDDIYVRASTLNSWFPVQVALSLNDLRLAVTTLVVLPQQQAELRHKAWEEYQKALALQTLETSNTTQVPYSMATLPALRLSGGTGYTINGGGDPKNKLTGNLTLQAEGDLLKSGANAVFNLDQSADKSWHFNGGTLTLTRQSISPSLLGPLKAREVQAGDVQGASLAQVGGGGNGRGVRVSNRPLGTIDDPNNFTITGNGPVGWDVEVYQDQTLLAFSTIDGTGRYNFATLPLKPGLNLFRTMLYGPSGERRQDQQQFYLGENSVKKGQFIYDVTANQPGVGVVPGGDGATPNGSPLALSALGQYGLSRNTTLVGGVLGTNGGASGTVAVTAGVRQALGNSYLTADASKQKDAGQTLAASFRSLLPGNTTLRVAGLLASGFTEAQRDVTRQGEISLAKATNLGLPLQHTLSYTRTAFVSQPESNNLSYRLSTNAGRFNLTNTLNQSWQGKSPKSLQGNAEVSTRVKSSTVRGSVNYTPRQTQVIRSAALSAQTPLGYNKTLNTALSHNFGEGGSSQLQTGLNLETGPWVWGLHSGVASTGEINLGANLSIALVPQGENPSTYRAVRPADATGLAHVQVRAFIDANADGKYQVGEKLVPKVTLRNRRRGSSQLTDANGIASFSDIPAFSNAVITMEVDSLPSIYLKPAVDNIGVLAHSGAAGLVDYPITLYGEVAGTVYDHATRKPAPNVTVQLLDAKGKVVDEVPSEYDGSYIFQALPLGAYTFSLKPADNMAGFTLSRPYRVTLTAAANTPDDIDLDINRPAAKAAPAVSPSLPEPK